MENELISAFDFAPPMTRRVLVVEDDLTIQPALERMIHKLDPAVEIDWSTCAEQAFSLLMESQRQSNASKLRLRPYQVVLADIRLGGPKTGFDLVSDCRQNRISTDFVLTSSNNLVKTTLPFLTKPLRFEDVKRQLGPYLNGSEAATLEWTLPLPRRDELLEWFMMLISAVFVVWLWSQLAIDFGHLPFKPL